MQSKYYEMLWYSCGNHGVLQLWNIAMFIHKIYSYSVTCTRDVRISLSILGLFLNLRILVFPYWRSLKISISILKGKARGMFPAFLAEKRKLRTITEYDCSNWKTNKKKFQIFFFFFLNHSPCTSVLWWFLCSVGFVLLQRFSLKHKLICRTAGKENQHVFIKHCGSLNSWMNLARSPPPCHPAWHI